MSIQMNLAKNATIVVSGEFESISRATKALATARMSGINIADRLVIQKMIDDNNLTATILYNGSPVFSGRRIANNLSEMRKTGLLTYMSDETYYILGNMFDYPRVNKQTYISAYSNSYQKLIKGVVINHHPGMPDVNMVAEILETELEKLCG